MAQSPCSFSSPCWIPLLPCLFPFHLLGNPPCGDRIRPPWSQVADKLSPQWVPQVNGEGVRCSLWAPWVKGPTPCSSGYISLHTNPFCIVHKAPQYILMDRMEPLILGLPKSRTIMSLMLSFENYIVNPVWFINVWLGSVKPSWDWLCVRVDRLNSAALLHD